MDETDSRLFNPFHDKITMDHRWSSSMSLNVFSLIDRKKKEKYYRSIHRKEDRSHRGNDWIEIFGQDHPDGSTPIHLNSIKSKAKRPKELVGGPRVRLWNSSVSSRDRPIMYDTFSSGIKKRKTEYTVWWFFFLTRSCDLSKCNPEERRLFSLCAYRVFYRVDLIRLTEEVAFRL